MIGTVLAMQGGLLRGALAYVLSTQDDINVIAELDNLDDVIASVRDDRPDVTVFDLDVVGADGSSAASNVYAELPDSRILVLADPRRPGLLQYGLTSPPPTVGFLAKTVPPQRVVDGIRRLARQEPVIDADLVVAALKPKGPLTARELQVLLTAAQGLPVKDVAAALRLSTGTVRNHLSRIVAKTGARTRIEAVRIAQDAGWI